MPQGRDEKSAFPGLRDLTEGEALAALEALFRSTAGYVVYRLRRTSDPPFLAEVEVVSPSIREMLRVSDPHDVSSWFAAVHADDLPRVMKGLAVAAADNVPFDEVFRIVHPGETIVWLHVVSHPVFGPDGLPTHYNGLMVDVTERMVAQEEAERLRTTLATAQRWEAVGALAASVAHDFNNLLQAIAAASAMIDFLTDGDERVSPLTEDIDGLVVRGAGLTRDLLTYAKRQASELEFRDVGSVVDRVGRLLSRMYMAVTVTVQHEDGLPPIRMDEGQVEQALLNLCLNAAHATGERGSVTLTVGRRTAADVQALTGKPTTQSYLDITVTDDGCGIPPEDHERIFEHFFTTKPEGKGTGLGLAAVQRIAARHDGMVHVESTLGVGSSFHLLLPESAGVPVRKAPTQHRASPLAPGDVVLVVDDEPQLRRVLTQLLGAEGYETVDAGTYDDALAAWEREPERFRLIITDTVMPGRGGLELVAHARRTRPGVPVVLMSGHTGAHAVDELVADGNTAFLAKPFSMAQLQDAIAGLFEPNDRTSS